MSNVQSAAPSQGSTSASTTATPSVPPTIRPLKASPEVVDRVTKLTRDVSTYSVAILNESSVGMYRIVEHVRKKVPGFVQQKHDLRAVTNLATQSTSQITEASDIIQEIKEIDSFHACEAYLARIQRVGAFKSGPHSSHTKKRNASLSRRRM
ncbi:hypothetical protein DFS34DRAFT_645500 [Phlyctochytrium arcticum]|nr:hypothetical protein DFS34DRAFT_645500 [Phlyctochytrium arcticum]